MQRVLTATDWDVAQTSQRLHLPWKQSLSDERARFETHLALFAGLDDLRKVIQEV